MGYKLPTIFQDQSEEARFINVVSDCGCSVKSRNFQLGGNVDLKVKLPDFKGVNISLHQLYFITHIFSPLQGDTATIPNYPAYKNIALSYQNINGFLQTEGVETGFNLNYRGFNFSVSYVLTDGFIKANNALEVSPLTSKHIVSLFAGYEIKHFFIGTDCYYYSPVQLSDGSRGSDIWEVGVSAQYAIKFILLFANIENIANLKQTTYGAIVIPNPTLAHPYFSEIYAPLEGRLFNAGIKIHLGAIARKKNATSNTERLSKKDTD